LKRQFLTLDGGDYDGGEEVFFAEYLETSSSFHEVFVVDFGALEKLQTGVGELPRTYGLDFNVTVKFTGPL